MDRTATLQPRRKTRHRGVAAALALGLLAALTLPGRAQDADAAAAPADAPPAAAGGEGEGEGLAVAEIPLDLIGDEHVREEFGINKFTTPSIRRLFESLDNLGTLPFDEVSREVSGRTPPERSKLALNLGILIADGFLVVHSEKVDELELVGRAILDYSQALGARSRVARHAKSLLEGSLFGDWESLKEELATTQADVEAEMILLRDSEVAHLISLGGWVRAFDIATHTVAKNYSAERAETLARGDIAAYYLHGLDHMAPKVQELPHIAALRKGVGEIATILDIPEGRTLAEEEVDALRALSKTLLEEIVHAPPK